jgi:hypothetical protein
VLRDDSDETFHTTQDSAMNDDRSRRGLVRVDHLLSSTVFEIETFGKLEVELNRRALERSMEGIANCDVDFGAVKCAISGVHIPFTRIVAVEGSFELLSECVSEGDGFAESWVLTSSAASQVSIVPK